MARTKKTETAVSEAVQDALEQAEVSQDTQGAEASPAAPEGRQEDAVTREEIGPDSEEDLLGCQDADEAELAQYGLDDPDLTVTVNYTAENEDGDEETGAFVLHVSRDLETKQAAEQAELDGQEEDEEEDLSAAYVRVGDSKIIYEISGDRYEELMAAFYDDLRHQEVFWADFDEVYQIGVSLEGTDYTIVSQKDGDERAWSYQEEEVDITGFQTALADLRADSFTSERPAGKEEIRFTLYLENENCPEVSVKLYRYDGELCLAEVDGKPVSLVRRSYAVDLIEAVHAIVLN